MAVRKLHARLSPVPSGSGLHWCFKQKDQIFIFLISWVLFDQSKLNLPLCTCQIHTSNRFYTLYLCLHHGYSPWQEISDYFIILLFGLNYMSTYKSGLKSRKTGFLSLVSSHSIFGLCEHTLSIKSCKCKLEELVCYNNYMYEDRANTSWKRLKSAKISWDCPIYPHVSEKWGTQTAWTVSEHF